MGQHADQRRGKVIKKERSMAGGILYMGPHCGSEGSYICGVRLSKFWHLPPISAATNIGSSPVHPSARSHRSRRTSETLQTTDIAFTRHGSRDADRHEMVVGCARNTSAWVCITECVTCADVIGGTKPVFLQTQGGPRSQSRRPLAYFGAPPGDSERDKIAQWGGNCCAKGKGHGACVEV